MEEETGAVIFSVDKKSRSGMRHKMARIEECIVLAFIFLSYLYVVVQFVIFAGWFICLF